MKKLLYTLVFLLISVLGATFAIQNAQMVTISWFGGIEIEQPLALVLALALAIGVLLGWLVSSLRGRRRGTAGWRSRSVLKTTPVIAAPHSGRPEQDVLPPARPPLTPHTGRTQP